ncbi:hypothetical protein NHJ13734_002616 [Beauveria thailandica]
MNPHPSTPTPRRFLNKRLASSSQLPPHSTPTPMRFQSTPRFVGGSTQSATRQMEDVVEEEEEEADDDDDVGASQSQSSSANEERPLRRSERRGIALLDSIEVDSCADSLTSREGPPSSSSRSSSSGGGGSSSSEHEMDEDGDERRPRGGYVGDGDKVEENGVATDGVHAELTYGDGEEEEEGTPKPVKRRRLSSASASASPTKLHMVVVAAAPYDSDTGGQHHHEQDDDTEQDDDDDEDDDDDDDDGEDDDDDVQDKTTRTRIPAQQPTFQPAPRFKPAAPEDEPFFASAGQVCAAVAPYSPPPRRGAAKYLAGGLASQLQGLLSKVKGIVETGNNNSNDDNDDDATGAVARVLVEEVRLGARMHLVRGRRILSRGPVAAAQCYMLAGGGGGGADAGMVKEGSVLRIMPAPAWNVHLGEEWTVACDWSVESLES